MLRFIKQTAADDARLAADLTELGLLGIEGFSQLEIPVSDFQEGDVFQIHQARSTGTKAFCNNSTRKDWARVKTGEEESHGDLRGRAVARLLRLLKIRNILS